MLCACMYCLLFIQACQKGGQLQDWGLGDISTVSCDASQSEPSQNKWTIKLSYTGGTDDRHSDVTFMYSPNDTAPKMTFDSEDPALDYVSSTSFHVITEWILNAL